MNLSIILNVLLLIGVIIAIAKIISTKKSISSAAPTATPSLKQNTTSQIGDDIISIRKIIPQTSDINSMPDVESVETLVQEETKPIASPDLSPSSESILMLLMAKENKQLAGYELLQTLLGAGMRFGEGQLFHRHQYSNGQGPIMCSLAAATPTGQFDLQSIGSFSVKGLCLFMQSSGNPAIDEERLSIMLETAHQLSEDLNTSLLDDKHLPLTKSSIARYKKQLGLDTLATVD